MTALWTKPKPKPSRGSSPRLRPVDDDDGGDDDDGDDDDHDHDADGGEDDDGDDGDDDDDDDGGDDDDDYLGPAFDILQFTKSTNISQSQIIIFCMEGMEACFSLGQPSLL